MNKKISKTKEQTEKRCEDKKQYNEDILRKVKDGNQKKLISTQICRQHRVLHDRGDSKITRGDTKFKYDSSKVNRATEANVKAIKAELAKKNATQININKDDKTKPVSHQSLQTENREAVTDKKQSDRQPSQKMLGRNDRIGNEKFKDSDQKKIRIKEIITIPYIPVDDSVTQVTDDEPEPIKPIIKNVTSKPSTKNLKTVTFKDQNPKLQSRNVERNNKPKISSAKTRIDRNKSKIQPTMKTQRRKKRFSASPVKCVINEFPPTEVVKWEPSCLTSQTRPYYEAWVDTTLTAFSKYSEDEKSVMEKDLLKALQHLKRPVSPELIYERFKDERYTGRIRIRRR